MCKHPLHLKISAKSSKEDISELLTTVDQDCLSNDTRNLISEMVLIDREIAKAVYTVLFLTDHHRSRGQKNLGINKRINI